MRRFFIRSGLYLLLLISCWLIFCQGCMTFRTADGNMKQRFRQNGVSLFTNTIRIEGHNLHFARTGSDTVTTIVFVHGTPGSWDAFAGYMQDSLLLSSFRMISIDRPGFGYSDFGKAEDLFMQSRLLNLLIERFDNGKPVILVGHSLGGPLIIRMSADRPYYYSGLVMISASIDPSEEKPEKWRPVFFKTPLNLFVPGAFRPSNEELWYLKKDLHKLKDDFNLIRCPVYFIHGTNDTWVRPENVAYGRKMLRNVPMLEEHMLKGGNHFIPWTRYTEIRNLLLHSASREADSARLPVTSR